MKVNVSSIQFQSFQRMSTGDESRVIQRLMREFDLGFNEAVSLYDDGHSFLDRLVIKPTLQTVYVPSHKHDLRVITFLSKDLVKVLQAFMESQGGYAAFCQGNYDSEDTKKELFEYLNRINFRSLTEAEIDKIDELSSRFFLCYEANLFEEATSLSEVKDLILDFLQQHDDMPIAVAIQQLLDSCPSEDRARFDSYAFLIAVADSIYAAIEMRNV